MSDFNTDTSGQKADEFTEPTAGPEPTEEEIAAADRSADEVDMESVDEHYSEMAERGKNTQGEGKIAP